MKQRDWLLRVKNNSRLLCGRTLFIAWALEIILGMIFLKDGLIAGGMGETSLGGILYRPFFLFGKEFPRLFAILQLLAGAYMIDRFTVCFLTTTVWKRVYAVLAILSVPYIAYAALTVSPYFGGFLFLLGMLVAIRTKRTVALYAFFAAAVLWLPEYILFGLVLLIVDIIARIGNGLEKKMLLGRATAFLLAILAVFGQIRLDFKSEDIKSKGEILVSRVALPALAEFYGNYPDELCDLFSSDVLYVISNKPETLDENLIRPLKELVGETRAEELLLEIGRCALWRSDIARREVMLDALGYVFTPQSVEWERIGHGYGSRTFDKLHRMQRTGPHVMPLYLTWGNLVLSVGIIPGGIVSLLRRDRKQKRNALVIVILLLMMASFYTLQTALKMDFTKVLLGAGWQIWLLLKLILGDRESSIDGEKAI